ncbi:NUDIX hydrolase [Pseudalkalibacillus decolorationis]|uniref:NUDIX hydrolase n=1 Tax=Pseudalkalibacillus decolorationis TaxID=163879 RepID=UPI002147D969|nr:NUDIX hydrolase [Pseudalkalibacillus decolorationis]
MGKRPNVWLAVSGIVEDNDRWLVVKKNYGGLKGKWSFPAGFVEEGETIDEAVKREVLEETGIIAEVTGVAGIRSGVIKQSISDNMIVFKLKVVGGELQAQEEEISEACFQSTQSLLNDPDSSLMIPYFLGDSANQERFSVQDLNPGNHFGYSKYKIFNLY